MANIFDGIYKADDKALIEQIAALESINLAQMTKPYLKKGTNKVIGVINAIGKKVGKDPGLHDMEVMEVWEVIDAKRSELEGCSRQELERRMLIILKAKSRCGESILSEEAVSIQVVEEAAEHYGISRDLSPAQKADAIYNRFSEKMMEDAQKVLRKQDESAARKTARNLDMTIEGMSPEEQQAVRRALNLDRLTGETILHAIKNTAKPGAILTAASLAGFGSSVALTTIIHAIFTTVLSITLPFAVYTTATSTLALLTGPVGVVLLFGWGGYQALSGNRKFDRELLAQAVWFARHHNGKGFTPPEDMLPSFIPPEDREKAKMEEDRYFKLLQEHEALLVRNQEGARRLQSQERMMAQLESKFREESRKRRVSETVLIDLAASKAAMEKERDELLEKQNHTKREALEEVEKATRLQRIEQELKEKEDDLEKVRQSMTYNQEVISEASQEINRGNARIQELEAQNLEYKRNFDALQDEMDRMARKVESKETYRREELTRRWSTYYDRFQIENKAIRDVLKFTNIELLSVEKRLIELHEMKDLRALSRGKMGWKERYDHAGVELHGSGSARIYYEVMNHSTKQARIVEILKKSNPKTQ